jgi:hypothetical protein
MNKIYSLNKMEKKFKHSIVEPVVTLITTLLLTAGTIIYVIDKFF